MLILSLSDSSVEGTQILNDTYYEELLLDVCVICGMGLMIDTGPHERTCGNCELVETCVMGDIDLSTLRIH